MDAKCESQMSVNQVPTSRAAESGGKLKIKVHKGKDKWWLYKIVKKEMLQCFKCKGEVGDELSNRRNLANQIDRIR